MQGDNGQVAVDDANEIIVAHRPITTSAASRALVPIIDDVRSHFGRQSFEASGDAGFTNRGKLGCSEGAADYRLAGSGSGAS